MNKMEKKPQQKWRCVITWHGYALNMHQIFVCEKSKKLNKISECDALANNFKWYVYKMEIPDPCTHTHTHIHTSVLNVYQVEV